MTVDKVTVLICTYNRARLLRETCAANDIELFESVMSLTGMVNVGKGAVVVGFAAPPHKFA